MPSLADYHQSHWCLDWLWLGNVWACISTMCQLLHYCWVSSGYWLRWDLLGSGSPLPLKQSLLACVYHLDLASLIERLPCWHWHLKMTSRSGCRLDCAFFSVFSHCWYCVIQQKGLSYLLNSLALLFKLTNVALIIGCLLQISPSLYFSISPTLTPSPPSSWPAFVRL